MSGVAAGPGARGRPVLLCRLGLAALGLAALALAWLAWRVNTQRACVLPQWPALVRCEAAADPAARLRSLQARVARNPGDAQAWVESAWLTSGLHGTREPRHDALLDMAGSLAGQDVLVQRMQVARAFERGHWPQAVDRLIALVEGGADPDAVKLLSDWVRVPAALAAMQPHIRPAAPWLGAVLDPARAPQRPVAGLMPLAVLALDRRALEPALALPLVGALKSQGHWQEAHALWRAVIGQPVPLVFNGGFDLGVVSGGFDWEVLPVTPSSAGAQVRQVPAGPRGGVLEVEFTGRPVASPLVRQHLLLLHTQYVLTGEFKGKGLRTDKGLAWVLQCASDGRELGRSPALMDTADQWKSFRLELRLPPACGEAVVLQLQTYAGYEAGAGLRGQASFDNLRLEMAAGRAAP